MGYFVSATKEKEAYIASTQFLFAFTGVINLVTRMINRIYTLDLIPATILGFWGITVGKRIGLKLPHKLDGNKMKKLVYAHVGISGLITVAQQLCPHI